MEIRETDRTSESRSRRSEQGNRRISEQFSGTNDRLGTESTTPQTLEYFHRSNAPLSTPYLEEIAIRSHQLGEEEDEEEEEDESMGQASIPSTMGVADFIDEGTGRMVPFYTTPQHHTSQHPPLDAMEVRDFSNSVIPPSPSPWGSNAQSSPNPYASIPDWSEEVVTRLAPEPPTTTSNNPFQNMFNHGSPSSSNPAEKQDDDVSVLTEYSGMEEEEEEDASSQITAATEARTVVTTTTGESTVPTRNNVTFLHNAGAFPSLQSAPSSIAASSSKRSHGTATPLENSQFKRRRVHR